MIVAELRELEKQVLQGEISYSRMVEIINERSESDAVEFAEWVERNYVMCKSLRLHRWVHAENNILVHGSNAYYKGLIDEYGKTTSELYHLFKQSK